MGYVVGIGGSLRDESHSLSALRIALEKASEMGAQTSLVDVNELDLPLFDPEEAPMLSGAVDGYLETVRRATALIWSTPAYHGTVSGAVKNALDYLDLLRKHDPILLTGRAVGLIAVAEGTIAAVNAINSMAHTAHALRAWVVPLSVPITRASQAFDESGQSIDGEARERLRVLGGEVAHWSPKLARTPVPSR